MKIVHCPRDEDPLTYARRHTRRGGGGGLGGLLQGNGMIIGLVVAMVIGTFTVGPLRPQKDAPQPEAPVGAAVEVVPVIEPVSYEEPVTCALPAGGRIEAGWEMFVQDGETIIHVRCENDGTLKKIETTG